MLLVSVLLPSCNTTKFLKDDELLLKGMDTKISTVEKIQNASSLKSELEQFYRQKPNRKFLFIPREWYWYRNQDPGDTTWIKKWTKNTLAEEPAILDTIGVKETKSGMQNYLINKKGFYNASVTEKIELTGKHATVTYRVKPGRRYIVNSITFIAIDTTLKPIIDKLASASLIKKGDPVDALAFDIEKQRIVSELQNRGYADFSLNFIDVKGDSSDLDYAIDIFFEVIQANNNNPHKIFRVGNLKIYTDYHQFQKEDNVTSQELFGSEYFKESNKFIVKPSTINKKIFLKNYEIYKAENYSKSIRKLFSLGTYKFVKLNPHINPTLDSIIDYSIFLTPHKNRWIFDLGGDMFFSNISRVDRNLVGFAIGTSLQNRNAFGGSETYKFSLETGVEFKAGTPIETNTFSLGLNNSIDIPKVSKPLNAILFLNKLGIIKDKSIRLLNDEGRTTFSLGFNYLDILDSYTIKSFNTSYGYDFKPSKRHRLVFNQIGFNLTEYDVKPAFQVILDTNPLQDRRFKTSFFSGLIFKDLTFYYQRDSGLKKSNWAFITSLELSGLEVYLANKLYNGIANSSSTWRINQNIEFEKHFRFSIDARWNYKITRNSRFAARIKSAVATAYGEKDGAVSFIKQLLVGGPNSLRAWRPMELGPGSFIYVPPANQDPIYFQRGDLSLEFNFEYRFPIYWVLEGAFFFDGGNVWTLNGDADRQGSKLTSQFYDEIALGYGYGLRWNFTYFIIRFDFGFKLRNPYPSPDNNSHWLPLKGQKIFGNPNIAINYPF